MKVDLRGCNQKRNSMYSSNDFERLFIRYKAEGLASGESIISFCTKNKVPYNLFEKWYKDTRHKLVPVQVDGLPSLSNTAKDDFLRNRRL